MNAIFEQIKRFCKYIYRLYSIYSENNLSESSAVLSYYMIFSFFPFTMVIYATLALININVSAFEKIFTVLMPEEVIDLTTSFYEHLSNNNSISFLILGIILTLYTMTRYIKSIESRIKNIYGNKTKTTIKSWGVSIIFSQLWLIAFYLSLFVLIAGENLLRFLQKYIYISTLFVKFYLLLRFFIIGAIIFIVIFLLYYILPAVKQKFSDIVYGTIFALLGWVVISVIFSFYMDNMSKYSIIYGSIGAFMILLLWLYLTNMLLLVGGVINSLIFKRRNEKNDVQKINYKKIERKIK